MASRKAYTAVPLDDRGTWINDGPSDMADVPQEIKDWAADPEHKLDDPFSREWYKLPVKHTQYAVKAMRRHVRGEYRMNDHPVPHKRLRSVSGDTFYYIGQDPETKAILWGTRET